MSHSFAPFGENISQVDVIPANGANVATGERVGSALLGGILTSYGLYRKDMPGMIVAVLGGLLTYRGISGQCECYRRLGIDTSGNSDGLGVSGNRGVRIERSILIDRSPMELYYFWHDLSNLSKIMPPIKSVDVRGSRSHWVVSGPAGHDVSWDAEFINEKPGELIAWQSLPGSEVKNAGSVRFESPDGGNSTLVKVAIEYLPPAGVVGAVFSSLVGASPGRQLEQALDRFKKAMEQ